MSLKTNRDKVVMHSVQGSVQPPSFTGYRVDTDGRPMVIPGTAAINYNVSVGDLAFGLAGDHIEPSVTIRHNENRYNAALNIFSCVGNTAKVVTGDAKGKTGYVLGAHGGVEHVIIQFDEETMENMTLDDKVLIKGYGQGLKFFDYPDVKLMSLDPNLLEKLNIKEQEGKLYVPVTAVVPQYLMGSGVGAAFSQKGDYDLITSDRNEIETLGLDKLRFGDFVYIKDADCSYGLGGVLKGASSIGVVVHSDCIKNGHGPGIAIVMTCKKPILQPKVDKDANLAKYMAL